MRLLIRAVVVAVALTLVALGRPSSSAAQGPPSAARLLAPETGVYLGAFADFGANEDRVSAGRLAAFERLAGKQVVWAYFSQNWYRGIRFPAEAVAAVKSRGAIPFIRMMPRSTPAQNVGADRRFSHQRIIDGAFDAQLAQWARDAAAAGTPVLVEFGPEVNGSWFQWSGRWSGAGTEDRYGDPTVADGPERFRDAYRHIIELFDREGAANVTWFFHVHEASVPQVAWNRMANYYPGDRYIDWLGISIYGATTAQDVEDWPSFGRVLGDAYGELTAISKSKPIAVLELGVAEDPDRAGRKAAWIRGALRTLASGRFARIRAASWWHERYSLEDDFDADLRIDSSRGALEAFRRGVTRSEFVTTPRLGSP